MTLVVKKVRIIIPTLKMVKPSLNSRILVKMAEMEKKEMIILILKIKM